MEAAGKKKAKKVSKTSVAGLVIPVGRVEKYVRETSHRGRVGYATATAISAAVGYVLEQLIDLAVAAMQNHKRLRIDRVHLQEALTADKELGAVIPSESIGAGFAGSAIEMTMEMEEEKQKKKEEGACEKKKRKKRARPASSCSRTRSPVAKRARKASKKTAGKKKKAKKPSAAAVQAVLGALGRSLSHSRSRAQTKRLLRSLSRSISRSRSRSHSRSRSCSRSPRRGGRPARR